MTGVSTQLMIDHLSLRHKLKVLFGNSLVIEIDMETEKNPGAITNEECSVSIGSPFVMESLMNIFSDHAMRVSENKRMEKELAQKVIQAFATYFVGECDLGGGFSERKIEEILQKAGLDYEEIMNVLPERRTGHPGR